MIFPPKKICIKESPDKGRGVFAAEPIVAEELVESAYIQKLITGEERLKTHCYSYPKGSVPPNIEYNFLPLGYGVVYNHSDNPNVDWQCDGMLWKLWAVRDIEAGEELCIRYNPGFWETNGVTPI